MTQQRVSPITVTSVLPAVPVLSLQAALGQSANLTEWKNSSGTVLASISSAGLASFPNLAVTSTTVPANGVYLPAANTLGFATNSTQVLQVNSTGNFGVGGSTNNAVTMRFGKNITGGTTGVAIANRGAIQSDVTNWGGSFHSNPDVANTAFTLGNIYHFLADQGTIGASATVTNQMGFHASSSITGATNNYGFYGNLASTSGRWNFYASGTAANYFAGQTTVGSTSLTLGSGGVAQQFGVVSQAAGNIVTVIRGAAAQTGNLTEWQDSSGTKVGTFNVGGNFGVRYLDSIAQTGSYITTNSADAIYVNTRNTAHKGLIVQGVASQSANLQEWQNSSATVLAKVDATGNFVVGNMAIATSSVATIHISNGTIPSANPTGGGVLYVEAGALKYRGSSGTITTIANA